MDNQQNPSPLEALFGPPGFPQQGVPFSDAVARKLGLDSPMGKTAYFASFKSSYPSNTQQQDGDLYHMLREEMVSRLAQK
jgi:hypothetical protein